MAMASLVERMAAPAYVFSDSMKSLGMHYGLLYNELLAKASINDR
jgi:hypothetical protein